MTLEAIAEMIENDILGGLKGVPNNSLSTQQIMEEINLVGNRMLHERNQQGFITPDDVYQLIPCIELECRDISECCDLRVPKAGETALMSTQVIPKLLYLTQAKPIRYVGTIDQNNSFKIVDSFLEARSAIFSPSGKLPTAFINEGGRLVIKNPPSESLKWITISALFAEPSELSRFSCMCSANGETDFKRPLWLIDQIKSKIVNDYLRYYRMGAVTQPNIQEQINMTTK